MWQFRYHYIYTSNRVCDITATLTFNLWIWKSPWYTGNFPRNVFRWKCKENCQVTITDNVTVSVSLYTPNRVCGIKMTLTGGFILSNTLRCAVWTQGCHISLHQKLKLPLPKVIMILHPPLLLLLLATLDIGAQGFNNCNVKLLKFKKIIYGDHFM